jgi:hypothetical protein
MAVASLAFLGRPGDVLDGVLDIVVSLDVAESSAAFSDDFQLPNLTVVIVVIP